MNSLLRTTVYGLFYTPSSSTEPIPSNLIPLKASLSKATHDDPEAIYSLSRHAKLMDSFLTKLLKFFFFIFSLTYSLSLPPHQKIKGHLFFAPLFALFCCENCSAIFAFCFLP
jgi:hypothetical protein